MGGKFPRTFKQYKSKIHGSIKSSDGFKKMKANVEQKGERKRLSEEKKARLANAEVLKSKGDFEQRLSGWTKSENKAAFSECRNTDHFKAQCHIWIQKKKSAQAKDRRLIPKGGDQKVRKGKVNGGGSFCLSGIRRNGPRK